MSDPSDITALLSRWKSGDAGALDALLPHVYQSLRKIAGNQLRGERADHTLSPTALINEAYMQLVRGEQQFENRGHFYAVAAMAMRRILVDYARQKQAQKRGGGIRAVTLEDDSVASPGGAADVLAIDRLLDKLSALSERQGKVVVCKFYAGLSDDETAAALSVSTPTVRRDWRAARAWLSRQLAEQAGSGGDSR